MELLSHMGSDRTIAEAAWVSTDPQAPKTNAQAEKLIRYLAKHRHISPFFHCVMQFRIKMPVFVARQFMRSGVGLRYCEPADPSADIDLGINEVSRRYVDTKPEFYNPGIEGWRARPEKSIKQGSGGLLSAEESVLAQASYDRIVKVVEEEYANLLKLGVAPELARIGLPVAHYTSFWMTTSLAAAARICSLRVDSHAQFEIQQYAEAISEICNTLYPISWPCLLECERTHHGADQDNRG